MKIWAHNYELISRHDGCKRHGALLRIQNAEGWFGYADCHPWPELGDLDLRSQLERLSAHSCSPLLERSIAHAVADATARQEHRSLFENLEVPVSHASLPFGVDEVQIRRAYELGYTRLKLKLGADVERGLTELLRYVPLLRETGLKLRLDFNEKPTFQAITTALSACSRACDGDLFWMDWIEDPCPFDASAWRSLKSTHDVRIALDRPFTRFATHEKIEDVCDVVVLKPAISDCARALEDLEGSGVGVAITSYLDHPVGQVAAAHAAAAAQASGWKLEQCGLVTQGVYEPSAFSMLLGEENPVLSPPPGAGIGFGDLLEHLDWRGLT